MARLGVNAPFGYGLDVERLLTAYRELGCAACQVVRKELRGFNGDEARRVAERAGVVVDSLHGVFGEQIDPSSPDRDERARCVRIYEDEGKRARDMGGPMVVVHPGAIRPGKTLMSEREAERVRMERREPTREMVMRLAEAGERLGVTYLIENLPRSCMAGHEPGELADVVRAAGSERVRMCLDLGHAHLTGDVAAAVRACAASVGYLHVHDNDGREDSHRYVGEGTIAWGEVTAALREEGLAGEDGPVRMLELFVDEGRVRDWVDRGERDRLREVLAVE